MEILKSILLIVSGIMNIVLAIKLRDTMFLLEAEKTGNEQWQIMCESYKKKLEEVWIELKKLQDTDDEKLIGEIIKRLPFQENDVTRENLLDMIDFFIKEWERLEDIEDKQFELSSLNYVHKREIRNIIRKLKKENKEDFEVWRLSIISELENLIKEN